MLFAASLATSSMILLSVPFAAAQIVVNSTGDEHRFPYQSAVCDTDPFDGVNVCTLRAAIETANLDPDVATITFNIPTTEPGYDPQTGSYTINVGSSTGSPLPELSTNVNITGPGADKLTVQRDPSVSALRIFNITTATTVNISGIRIKDGSVGVSMIASGAGIQNANSATLNVNGCVFIGNAANNGAFGGGFANASTGNVTFTSCLFTENHGYTGGGAVANLSTGTVTMTDCRVEANTSSGAGGGAYNLEGTLHIIRTTVENNAGESNGGGVANGGSCTITDSTISSNRCAASQLGYDAIGGGVSSGGSLVITNSTVSDNSVIGANGPTAGTGGSGQGGGVYSIGSLTIIGSTIASNTATGGAGGRFGDGGQAFGGGLISLGNSAVINCTFTGNSVQGGSSPGNTGGSAEGGGIYFRSPGNSFTLNNSTVVLNSAVPGSGSPQGNAAGGGLLSNTNPAFSGSFVVNSSLVASNSAGSAPDVSGAFVSQGHNLIGIVDGGMGFSQPADKIGTAAAPLDPKIDAAGLRNNGGPTQTVAILRTSIAINNGAPDSPSTDQRGVARVNAPDIGAFEFNGSFFAATLQNISTRGLVGIGDEVMIGGFIISGTGDKKVLLRAIGPSLSNPPVSLTGTLQDPTISLFNVSGKLISNDNWADASNAQSIDPALRPTNGLESAILISLPPGAYTAIVSGVGGGTGIGLVEVFDMDATVPSKLSNISTRGLVETGDNVLIGGLVVQGPESETVVVRAIGPSLADPPVSLTNVLQNPFLGLFNDQGSRIQFNDDWQSDQANDIIATGLQPSNPAESVIVRTLTPGNYTAIVTGVNNTTGIALVEVYERN